ncbi:uncharacterized protein LOC143297248 isoform X1 [Babylonia areolata]|uniref:uncharacterized protein LOC143297248 isoform X1 n=1 Tax=Babylonia areolata TaxID=304850 RepID=UPI003FD49294
MSGGSGRSLLGSDTQVLHQGWVGYSTPQNENTWYPAWCVLTNQRLVLSSSEDVGSADTIFFLKLNPTCSLHWRPADHATGYEFRLMVARNQVIALRVKTSSDRDVWTARIEGAVRQQQQTRDACPPVAERGGVEGADERPPPSRAPAPPPFCARKQQGLVPGRDDSGMEDYLEPVSESTWEAMRRNDSSRSTDSGRYSGSFEKEAEQAVKMIQLPRRVPDWLFENCSRDQAIKILNQCDPKFGNTLIRRAGPTAEYAITKRSGGQEPGSQISFSHYKVLQENGGYRIDVIECPGVMGSLEEVMEKFVRRTGARTTLPMTCNDLHTLGISGTHPGPSMPAANNRRLPARDTSDRPPLPLPPSRR